VGEEISEEDLKDLISIMKKEKEGLQAIQDSINNQAKQLMIMERELNNL